MRWRAGVSSRRSSPGVRWWHDDAGFATVAAALAIAGLVTVLLAVMYLGAVVLARHRAQSAADLGALAAAQVHVRGDDGACGHARALIEKQDGSPELAACRIDGADVLVQVRVPVRLGRWGPAGATARARAGP